MAIGAQIEPRQFGNPTGGKNSSPGVRITSGLDPDMSE